MSDGRARPPPPRACNRTFGDALPDARGGPKRGACPARAHPVHDFFFLLKMWSEVQGFIGLSTAYFIHAVSLTQCSLGVTGAIGEIGVAAGKSFSILAHTRRVNESLMAADLFSTGVEKDNCPETNLPMFLDHVEYLGIPPEDVRVLRGDSLGFLDVDLAPEADSGFRLFHVDGAHVAESTLHDLNIAACALVPGGVVLVDDLHNLRWPGVQEGFHRYMRAEPQARRLEPFLYTGRIFLTTPGYGEVYREALRKVMPSLDSFKLYGQELLSAQRLNFRLEDFERLYEVRAAAFEPLYVGRSWDERSHLAMRRSWEALVHLGIEIKRKGMSAANFFGALVAHAEDGDLTFVDFSFFMRSFDNSLSKLQLQRLWDHLDGDDSGRVSREEFATSIEQAQANTTAMADTAAAGVKEFAH